MSKGHAKISAPRLLVTQREQAIWLERARVHADHGRVIYQTREADLQKSYAIPHANVAILFLGQGTSVTQEASRLLAEEGVLVAFVGTGGSPLHYGALTNYGGTTHFRRMLTAYIDPEQGLRIAKEMMRERVRFMEKVGFDAIEDHLKTDRIDGFRRACSRFRPTIDAARDIMSLLGHEGQYAKALFAAFAGASRMGTDFVRRQDGGDRSESPYGQVADPVMVANDLIDHGNYLAYGFAAAALWALGIPPHMSVLHGKTRSGGLVFDLADVIKEAIVLPLAFAVASGRIKGDSESVFRAAVMRQMEKQKVLSLMISFMDRVLPDDPAGLLLNTGKKPDA
ncbi:type I-F CRISPR-associated endonuclease Cas1f [Paracoccus sp. ME4]|uniref:type I-F CRISPR-associated endonuclease Cas1f n=1 Tax=Paracoccus sp. ME4 TaxID=3138066 RepID=UPI00398B9156